MRDKFNNDDDGIVNDNQIDAYFVIIINLISTLDFIIVVGLIIWLD